MDKLGRIVLTIEMRKAAQQAERVFESSKCLNEDAFQKKSQNGYRNIICSSIYKSFGD